MTEQDKLDEALDRMIEEEWARMNQPEPKPRRFHVSMFAVAGLLILTVYLLTAVGCNTLAGVGQDIQAAAKGTQNYLSEGVDGQK